MWQLRLAPEQSARRVPRRLATRRPVQRSARIDVCARPDHMTPIYRKNRLSAYEILISAASYPARSSLRRPLLGHHGEHVVPGDRGAILVGDVGVPAHLAMFRALAGGDLLAGQRHRQLVAGIDRREEA